MGSNRDGRAEVREIKRSTETDTSKVHDERPAAPLPASMALNTAAERTTDTDTHAERPVSQSQVEGDKAKQINSDGSDQMTQFMKFVRQSFQVLNEKVDKIAESQDTLERNLSGVSAKADANEQAIADLKRSVEFNAESIKEAGVTQAKLVTENEELKRTLDDTRTALTSLQQQVLRNERHSRAFNIRVLGVDEAAEGSTEDCVSVVQSLLEDKFSITDDVIETAHRTGKHTEGQPRHIIARFYSRPVRHQVMRQTREALQGTEMRLVDDLCAADAAEKRRLKPLLEKLYKDGKRPSFRNGQLYVAGKPFRNTDAALAGLYK